jgi:hypothetical protein
MATKSTPSRWWKHAGIAFLLAFVVAGLLHGYDCRGATTDQCLVSKGLFPYYFAIAFLVLWPIVAAIANEIRYGSRPRIDPGT